MITCVKLPDIWKIFLLQFNKIFYLETWSILFLVRHWSNLFIDHQVYLPRMHSKSFQHLITSHMSWMKRKARYFNIDYFTKVSVEKKLAEI